MAVKRIFEPGCNLQFMLVLIGNQGAGKSAFVNILGGKWVNKSALNINTKDAYIALLGSWFVEVAEMYAISSKEAACVKGFISSNEDCFRPPFGKRNERFKRQCIFVGTTNETVCFNDATGNSRFWPIESKATETDACERINMLQANRYQLWAESVYLYHTASDRIEELIRKESTDMKVQQERHNRVDVLKVDLQRYLDFELPEDWENRTTSERQIWFKDSAVRNQYYNQHGHASCHTRNKFQARDFCVEYMGMTILSKDYQSTCHLIHKAMGQFADWEALEGNHRGSDKNPRLTYVRIDLFSANTSNGYSQVETCIPKQKEFDFMEETPPTSNAPLPF